MRPGRAPRSRRSARRRGATSSRRVATRSGRDARQYAGRRRPPSSRTRSYEILQGLRAAEGDERDRGDDQEDDDRDGARQAVVLAEALGERELVRVADENVRRAGDGVVADRRPAVRQQVDVAAVVEVERERGDQKRRNRDEQQR